VGSVKKNKPEREPVEEIVLLDDMLSALVDLLIEKGIITEDEYERRVKQRVKLDSSK
jgi:hypothetical protein